MLKWNLRWYTLNGHVILLLFRLSLLMRKPTICICENKGADQLRGYREADQRLCFRYTDSTIPLLSKIQNFLSLAIFCACTARFVSDLFGNHIVGCPTRRLVYFRPAWTCIVIPFILDLQLHPQPVYVMDPGQRYVQPPSFILIDLEQTIDISHIIIFYGNLIYMIKRR